MDDFELEKETYGKVVSFLQAGKKSKALESILPETNDDSELAETVLKAIERSLKKRSKSKGAKSGTTGKKSKKKAPPEKGAETGSSESGSPETSIIHMSSESVPRRKKKGTLLGDHKGISGIELEKEVFLEVVELIKAGKRDEACDLIFEEATESRSLAKQVLEAIEKTLPKKPEVKKEEPETSEPPVSPKEKCSEGGAEVRGEAVAQSSTELPLPPNAEADALEQAENSPRQYSLKPILAGFALCLITGLLIEAFYSGFFSGGKVRGSDPEDQATLNFVAVAMCPLLSTDLDLHSGQRSFCERKRKRFAYFLYEECQKIAGTETIRGPFSEETLQAGLYVLGKEIRGQLDRGQRRKFLSLYEKNQWRKVDIVDYGGRLRLEYPKYGNVSGEISLSVASQKPPQT